MERRGRWSNAGGFSLIELVVIVLLIAILLLVALPTYLGARNRAADRAAQARVRDAHIAEFIYYADEEEFTEDEIELRRIEPSVEFKSQLSEIHRGDPVVYVEVETASEDLDTVVLGAKSTSGACFWMRTSATRGLPRFASNESCEVPDDEPQWKPRW